VSIALRVVAAWLCLHAVLAASAIAQRRSSAFADAYLVNSAANSGACESTATDRNGVACSTALLRGVNPPRVYIVAGDSTTSHTLLGIMVGAVSGGVIAIGVNRVVNGKCDEDNDNLISCGTAYGILFGVGAVPGALIGGIIGSQIKTPKR
jgi:hypothetical protein